MGMTPARRTRAVIVLAALTGVAMVAEALLLWRDASRNALIEAGAVPTDATVPALRFAAAYALDGTRDAAQALAVPSPVGRVRPDDEALNRYRGLQADAALGIAARFNGANLLLRQAIALRAGPLPANALPLFELAKQQYRELLALDPQHWDARYNLERAQRLLPDPPEDDLEPTAAPRERERAATTMRAQSLGLP